MKSRRLNLVLALKVSLKIRRIKSCYRFQACELVLPTIRFGIMSHETAAGMRRAIVICALFQVKNLSFR